MYFIVSFINLGEANVLAAVRRNHQVATPKIRTALDVVREHLRISRPLADEKFATDEVDLFFERYGRPVDASRKAQLALRETISQQRRNPSTRAPFGLG